MENLPPISLFDSALADEQPSSHVIDREQAEKIFNFFKGCSLFRWSDANNDCEDRANALCMLLDRWGIGNCKAWVFSGNFNGKQPGYLNNYWNYHVATALPVQYEDNIVFYVIDPATSPVLTSMEEWALQITESQTSYHFIKHGNYYIFPSGKIEKDNWHKRNKRNYNWTMQGLSGINGVSAKGKAQLAFFKNRSKKTEMKFRKLLNERPLF